MTFDPDAFMAQSIDAQMDTQRLLCPEGDFRAMLDDFEAEKAFRTFTSAKNNKDYTVFSPPFVIQDDKVAADLGQDKVIVYHKGMFIDVDETTGGLATGKGKNVDLGQLRDAVGQNGPGPWSFMQLRGAGPVMVHVVHDQDPNDRDRKWARVNRVVKIS
jgi:hypothetical protein